MPTLAQTAATLVEGGRGILAADESPRTMSSRMRAEGIDPTAESRRDYRELLVRTPGLSEHVSGVILADETFWQSTTDGTPMPQACRDAGIVPGIKVDTGTVPLPRGEGALVTEGLDGLRDRLARYAGAGAGFAKWRAVIDVGTASDLALAANAHALARYAALCQEAGIVPVVEPEVLATGTHTIEQCAVVMERTLTVVFAELARHRVEPEGMVLKPPFVTPGLDGEPAPAHQVASRTAAVLRECVPASVPGVAFLSGGHSSDDAFEYLGVLNEGSARAPWHLTFSFGRALVSEALHVWAGDPTNVHAAQEVLFDRCRRASEAVRRHPALTGDSPR